jgi:hypothetical protein
VVAALLLLCFVRTIFISQVERFRDFIADNDAKRNRAELKAQVSKESFVSWSCHS